MAEMVFEAMKVEEGVVRKWKARHEVDPSSIPE